jgi:HD-GYP domain-containing protein (c-di-GMP phosphodiesterase class II)
MIVAQPQDIEMELVDDFFYDFHEHYQRSEDLLIKLEKAPSDSELTNSLFRCVHTIKGNLIYIGLKELCPLLQGIEDVLDGVRHGQLRYDDSLSDVVLLAMDKTKALIDENIHGSNSGISFEQFEQICRSIAQIAQVDPQQRPVAIKKSLNLLDPQSPLHPLPTPPLDSSLLDDAAAMGIRIDADHRFVHQLIPSLEHRSPFWKGYTDRIAKLSLLMNEHANRAEPPEQLLMAAMAHDIAMPFLPLSMLHKDSSYVEAERQRMQHHVRLGADLLQSMGGWEEAAIMVLQHHEHCDGSGYPNALTSKDICNGAKILSIADTYDACRYNRAYRTEQKRPLIRAVLEINRQAGSQFDDAWVQIFNQVAKREFTLH